MLNRTKLLAVIAATPLILGFTAPVFAQAADAGVSEPTTEVSVIPEVEEPADWDGAFSALLEGIDAVRSGKWLLMAVALIQLLMFGLKKLKTTFVKTHGKAIALVLSAAGGIIVLVLGDNTVVDAFIIFAVNGLSPFIHDLAHHYKLLEHKEETADV